MRGGLGVTLHAQLPGLPVLSRPGHSLSAIQRSMSSQVLGRVSAGSAQAASSISVMMYPGAS
jgi:hypothetical protein